MQPIFEGKTFVVTGATSGIGLATAAKLAELGADVIGVGRSAERIQASQNEVRRRYPRARVTYLQADLSLQSEVRRLAAEIHEQVAPFGQGSLDGLVNNAGTFTYWMTLTAEGFETQWAVNHLAPFLLTHEVLDLLRAAPAARVVTVSSDSHYNTRLRWKDIQLRRNYNGLLAYQQTKLANVLFSRELNRRLGADSRLRALAADPGLVNTDIGLKDSSPLARWVWERRRRGGDPAEKPAEGIAFLLGMPLLAAARQAVYWKDGQPRRPSRYALDDQAARSLWAISEQMCALCSAGYGLAGEIAEPGVETRPARGWSLPKLRIAGKTGGV